MMRDLIATAVPPWLEILAVLGAVTALALLLRALLGRDWLCRTIFQSDTPAGRRFDLGLLAAIVLSVLAVVLESDPVLRQRWLSEFRAAEWSFTVLFTLEYLLRLLCAPAPAAYARSFFGLVDLLAIVPSFLGLVLPGAYTFIVVRVLRLLRVFRVLKLGEYLQESDLLWTALWAGRRKIAVFLLAIVALVVLIGSVMFALESSLNPAFRSIPVGIYWAIVTVTTVGYGDVAPVTPPGRLVASATMLIGYSIIAVPTGILTAELGSAVQRRRAAGSEGSDDGVEGEGEAESRCPHCGALRTPGSGPHPPRSPDR
jgi:voltage-gated potassium channel